MPTQGIKATTGSALGPTQITAPEIPQHQDVVSPVMTIPSSSIFSGGIAGNLEMLAKGKFLQHSSLISIPVDQNATAGNVVFNAPMINEFTSTMARLYILMSDRFMGSVEYRLTVFGASTLIGALEVGTTISKINNPTINDLRVLEAVTIAANDTNVYTFTLGPVVANDGVQRNFFPTHEDNQFDVFPDVASMDWSIFPHFVMIQNVPIQANIASQITNISVRIESRLSPDFMTVITNVRRLENMFNTLVVSKSNSSLVSSPNSKQIVSSFNGKTLQELFLQPQLYISKDGLYGIPNVTQNFVSSFNSAVYQHIPMIAFSNHYDPQSSHIVQANSNGFYFWYSRHSSTGASEEVITPGLQAVSAITQYVTGSVPKSYTELSLAYTVGNSNVTCSYLPVFDHLLAEYSSDFNYDTINSGPPIFVCQRIFGDVHLSEHFIPMFRTTPTVTTDTAQTMVEVIDIFPFEEMFLQNPIDPDITGDKISGSNDTQVLEKIISNFRNYFDLLFNQRISSRTFQIDSSVQLLRGVAFDDLASQVTVNLSVQNMAADMLDDQLFDVQRTFTTRDYDVLPISIGLRVSGKKSTYEVFFYLLIPSKINEQPEDSAIFRDQHVSPNNMNTQVFQNLSHFQFEPLDFEYRTISFTYADYLSPPIYRMFTKVPEQFVRIVFTTEIPSAVSTTMTVDGLPTVASLVPLFPDLDSDMLYIFDIVSPQNRQTLLRMAYSGYYKTFYCQFDSTKPIYATLNTHDAASMIVKNIATYYIGSLPSMSLIADFLSRVVELKPDDNLMLRRKTGYGIATTKRKFLV